MSVDLGKGSSFPTWAWGKMETLGSEKMEVRRSHRVFYNPSDFKDKGDDRLVELMRQAARN